MAKIIVNLPKLTDNLTKTKKLCEKNNLRLLVVTKSCGGDLVVLRHLAESGACSVAGTHPQHFDNINGVEKTLLIVLPAYPDMLSRCDYAYVTELKTLEQISKSSESKRVGIVIPLEFGDLREGVSAWEIIPFMEKALKLTNLRIEGFGANFGCLKELPPKPGVLEMFAQCVDEIRIRTGYQPKIVTLGGSALWEYLITGRIPKKINQMRIGEAIFLGTNPGLCHPIPGLHQDGFVLEGRIIEIKHKRLKDGGLTLPWDDESDTHLRKRAVLDFGYTACRVQGLTPLDNGIKVMGACQDLTVIDVTDSESELSVGDPVKFVLDYKSLAIAMICPYLEKTYVK